jgi:23S rRNA G2069 N7-methylase RlmK/C1962 C5-methylase RlmI
MFANRLRKRAKHLARWARRTGASCYRVYDCDIPEVPRVVDWYEGRLHVSAFAREGDPVRDDAWLEALAGAAGEALGVERRDVFAKRRGGQPGATQYERVDAARALFTVLEHGSKLEVNLSDYVDTGLFLDHRETRARVRAEANGKRFLNLFCYTGAFTVHAAAGGARASTSVDLSKTYLEWAGRNLALNGLAGPEHELVRADALEWLQRPGEPGSRANQSGGYDLAVLDPPTFSNSKKMKAELDVQRDHVALIHATLAKLVPGGVLWFSTNYRRFKLDAPALRVSALEDLSRATLPEDFRDLRARYVWRMVR